jgi:O-antigen/teichoic acid export membrane protein
MVGPIGGRLIAVGVMGSLVIGRVFFEFGIQFDFQLLRKSFSFNFYSFIYQLQQWVINYFDRYIILLFLPLSSVGVYDFSLKCMLLIEFIASGFHSSYYPKVLSALASQTVKGSTPEINRYYYGFTSMIMMLTCLSLLIFPWLIQELFDRLEYRAAVVYFPFIGLYYLLRPMRLFFSVPYTALKYVKPLPIIYFLISVVKIGAMIILIQKFGFFFTVRCCC